MPRVKKKAVKTTQKPAANKKMGKRKVSAKPARSAKVVKATRRTKAAKPVKTTKVKTVKVSAVPQGYHSITPYLIVANAIRAIEFYKKVFAAKEVMRMDKPGGKISHAELRIGNAKIMLADECPEMNALSPMAYDGSAVGIHLYTENVDRVMQQAVAAGAKLARPVETMFYGDRCGALEDPFGHKWFVSTHVEDVSPREMKKRAAKLYSGNK